MAGHNKWKQIKERKGVQDAKKSQNFAKLASAIVIAAREETNPDFNPRLRTLIDKARELGMPQDNITRAIERASSREEALESLLLEAYGPGGTAILIEAITPSKNKTIAEIKHLLKEHNGKWAEPGSVRWAFETTSGESQSWTAKFTQQVTEPEKEVLQKIIEILEEHEDVQKVYTNAQ